MRVSRIVVLLLLCTITMGIGSVEASIRQRKPKKPGEVDTREVKRMVYGFKIGMMGGGRIYTDVMDSTLNSGYSVAAFLDFKTRLATSIGLSVEAHRVRPKGIDIAKTMLDISICLKGSFYRDASRFFVRPCVSVGYGHLGGESPWYASSSYLLLKGSLELLWFPREHRNGYIGEIGLLGSPYGRAGSSPFDVRITADPRLLVRVGIAFR
jgi:hypothetical protein